MRLFNEVEFGNEIARVFGEDSIHMETYRELISRLRDAEDKLETLTRTGRF